MEPTRLCEGCGEKAQTFFKIKETGRRIWLCKEHAFQILGSVEPSEVSRFATFLDGVDKMNQKEHDA